MTSSLFTWLVYSNFAAITVLAKNQSVDDLVALISVKSPESIAGNFPGYYAMFSEPPPPDSLAMWVPEGDPEGCQDPLPSVAASLGSRYVAILKRGTCTFVDKALHAQKAGAAGLIIVSDTDVVQIMGGGNTTDDTAKVDIMVVGMAKTQGEKLINFTKSHPDQQVVINFSVYHSSIVNFSELALICLATSLVVAGAYFATADLRVGSPLAPRSNEEVVDVTHELALSFCVLGSVMLVVLFFLMKYMIYFIIFAFCIGGFSCISQIGGIFLAHMNPSWRRGLMNLPEIGTVTTADVIASVPAAILVICWLVLRNTPHGWPFQDIIGAGFLCWMQRTLRLPNIKVATLLLSCMFFFDIFWVFVSPLLFKKSVMVEVATGGGTGETVPMLLRIPAFGDPLGRDRMLGFGDIALPGLLISYLRRHDLLGGRSGCAGYFVPAVIGYFIGLCVTIVALMIMQMGQPALLYLVPGTLGTTLTLGCIRGEIPALWEGKPKRDDNTIGAMQVPAKEDESPLTDNGP